MTTLVEIVARVGEIGRKHAVHDKRSHQNGTSRAGYDKRSAKVGRKHAVHDKRSHQNGTSHAGYDKCSAKIGRKHAAHDERSNSKQRATRLRAQL